uniref:Uncharacterized protein n=1 Tax=Sphaerodactylus townsendi TaxID=933632 RepID=A0ACB8ECQ3_9SAUR
MTPDGHQHVTFLVKYFSEAVNIAQHKIKTHTEKYNFFYNTVQCFHWLMISFFKPNNLLLIFCCVYLFYCLKGTGWLGKKRQLCSSFSRSYFSIKTKQNKTS